MVKTLTHFSNNQLTQGTSGRRGDVHNPATGTISARVPLANALKPKRHRKRSRSIR